jgi:protein associated with RNAse G/E
MTQSPSASSGISAGEEMRIVKLSPDGNEAATYNGTLVHSHPGWLVVRATWTFRRMALGYMTFEPGDYLLEYFATERPFNAFVLFSPQDEFKGWYCNITYPSTVEDYTLYWHDLYVDVIQKADGTILVLDEDELEASGLERHDPALHTMILDARDLVVEKMRTQAYPFSEFTIPNG